jgi:uncharacterized protein (TIGR02271 family)
MKETRRKQHAAFDAVDQITHPQRGLWTGQRVTLAIATVAGLALASGCASKEHTSSCYSPPPSTAYAPPPEQPPPKQTATTAGPGDIVVPLSQETVSVGKQEVDGGSVRLKKIVKTETINQPVEVRREEIVIDRSNATGEANTAKAFSDEDTVIPLRREEVVIQKQIVPAGQIVVHRRWTTEKQTATAQVRREDIDLSQLNQPGVTVTESAKSSTSATGGATSPGGTSTGSASSDTGIITEPGALSEQNAAKFNGWQVKFSHMKVHKTYGERVFDVTSEDGRPLYFVMNEPPPSAIREGDMVLVTGKIKQRAGTVTQTGLESQGAEVINQQAYYIEVQKLETAK